MNLLPAEDHGTDFSRVRPWFLDNQAALYRQTIVLSGLMEPQVCGLFHRKCRSYAGKVRIRAVAEQGTCSTLDVPVKQLFQRLHCDRYVTTVMSGSTGFSYPASLHQRSPSHLSNSAGPCSAVWRPRPSTRPAMRDCDLEWEETEFIWPWVASQGT